MNVKYYAGQQIIIGPTVYYPGNPIPLDVIKLIPDVQPFVSSYSIIRIEEGQELTPFQRQVLEDAKKLGLPDEPEEAPVPEKVKGVKLKQEKGFTAEELIGDQHEKTKAPWVKPQVHIPAPPKAKDPRAIVQEAFTKFDPNVKTVKEVVEYLKANPEQLEAVIAKEKAGKNREYAAKLEARPEK